MSLATQIDRIYLINLPEQTTRRIATLGELQRLGFAPGDPRIEVPFAPRPPDANGFPSKGVYGNFLSHLGILRDAREKGYERIWVLEDDAIFSKRFVREQGVLAELLMRESWDLCFPGHSLKAEIAQENSPIVRTQSEFMWMHCILVHRKVLDRLIAYFEATLTRPAGDPLGGKMYIDGAYNMFRRLNPDVVTFVTRPAWSLQRGGPSSLAKHRWYDGAPILGPVVRQLRRLRDDAWRHFG